MPVNITDPNLPASLETQLDEVHRAGKFARIETRGGNGFWIIPETHLNALRDFLSDPETKRSIEQGCREFNEGQLHDASDILD